jgi:predicted nucleic acid-binding protein
VTRWIREVPSSALHLSVLSLGEIRRGVESLPDGARKERLRVWLEQELPAWFEDRLLSISAPVADRWGRLLAAVGRPVPAIDSLLAATAVHHGLRLVTRNAADFRFPGLDVVDPWRS